MTTHSTRWTRAFKRNPAVTTPVKGTLIFLAAGLVFSGLAYAPALLPQEPVEDEKIRLDPGTENYGTPEGERGFAIGLPRMTEGHHVNVTWETRAPYNVRILPAAADGSAPAPADVEALFAETDTVEGVVNFTAPADGSYWITFTVDAGEGTDRGTIELFWDPPMQPSKTTLYRDFAQGLLTTTLVLTAVFFLAGQYRKRVKAKRGSS